MAAHVVGRLADLEEGRHLIVEIGGRSIGIVRANGRLYGIRNMCPHQQGPLCEGGVFPTHTAVVERVGEVREFLDHERPVISCPWHGWEFDLSTGTCLADPSRRVATYEVVVESGNIVVHVG
jgi:3-phenylpropionate/trans-cinnamate dioxygenase ferredoxin subunit